MKVLVPASQADDTPRDSACGRGNGELVVNELSWLNDRCLGFGKRSSSYEYRVTGRGGSGIVAIGMGKKNSAVIASFPVEESDDLMLISDAGQTIRVAVSGISVQGRAAQGVTVFRVDEGEKVVSVERIADVGGGE